MSSFLLLLDEEAGGGPVTYATWNPADKNANVILSGGDLIAGITTGGIWSPVRANVGKATGKWMWEDTIHGGSVRMIGIATASATLASYLGSDAYGYGYFLNDGSVYHNASNPAYGAPGTDGDVFTHMLNMDTLQYQIKKNGTTQGFFSIAPLSGLTVFPATSLYSPNTDTTETNFGATAFIYPQAGYAGVSS